MIRSITVQPDGKILAAAFTGKLSIGGGIVVRYESNGALDATFDNDGQAIVPMRHGNFATCGMGAQPDGKVVLGGRGFSPETGTDFAFVRIQNK